MRRQQQQRKDSSRVIAARQRMQLRLAMKYSEQGLTSASVKPDSRARSSVDADARVVKHAKVENVADSGSARVRAAACVVGDTDADARVVAELIVTVEDAMLLQPAHVIAELTKAGLTVCDAAAPPHRRAVFCPCVAGTRTCEKCAHAELSAVASRIRILATVASAFDAYHEHNVIARTCVSSGANTPCMCGLQTPMLDGAVTRASLRDQAALLLRLAEEMLLQSAYYMNEQAVTLLMQIGNLMSVPTLQRCSVFATAVAQMIAVVCARAQLYADDWPLQTEGNTHPLVVRVRGTNMSVTLHCVWPPLWARDTTTDADVYTDVYEFDGRRSVHDLLPSEVALLQQRVKLLAALCLSDGSVSLESMLSTHLTNGINYACIIALLRAVRACMTWSPQLRVLLLHTALIPTVATVAAVNVSKAWLQHRWEYGVMAAVCEDVLHLVMTVYSAPLEALPTLQVNQPLLRKCATAQLTAAFAVCVAVLQQVEAKRSRHLSKGELVLKLMAMILSMCGSDATRLLRDAPLMRDIAVLSAKPMTLSGSLNMVHFIHALVALNTSQSHAMAAAYISWLPPFVNAWWTVFQRRYCCAQEHRMVCCCGVVERAFQSTLDFGFDAAHLMNDADDLLTALRLALRAIACFFLGPLPKLRKVAVLDPTSLQDLNVLHSMHDSILHARVTISVATAKSIQDLVHFTKAGVAKMADCAKTFAPVLDVD